MEQVPLISEEPLTFDPDNNDGVVVEALGIDRDSYRYVGQGYLYSAEPHIKVIRSEGFVNCSAWIIRNLQSGEDTFAHYWPGETDDKMHSYLESQSDEEEKQAVIVYGSNSLYTGFERGLQNGGWGNIEVRSITIDSGNTWWGAVFDRVSGDLTVVRRKPGKSMLKYNLFDGILPL